MKMHFKFKDPRKVRVFFPDACKYLAQITEDPRWTHAILHFTIQSHRKRPSFLVACRSLYKETGNPLFVWKAIQHQKGKNLPRWVRDYTVQSAGDLLSFDGPVSGAKHIPAAMGFNGDAIKPYRRLIKELASVLLVFTVAPNAESIAESSDGTDAITISENYLIDNCHDFEKVRISYGTLNSYRKSISTFIDLDKLPSSKPTGK
jgi:hypothetical protein